ncbi:hypothetical protein T484DRAFT_1833226 [Baffinella frigidus]|nr:hypothetical protein T484DRAFT_1833226 [Cryptophyta sp. CCMP2293]
MGGLAGEKLGRGLRALAELASSEVFSEAAKEQSWGDGAGALTEEAKAQFWRDGFLLVENLNPLEDVAAVRGRLDGLFRGEFDTGVYPDEWHWREGISLPDAPREICNAWKADSTIERLR